MITLLSYVFPDFFVKKAYQQLTHPKFYPYRTHEKDILEDAIIADLAFKKGNIKTYKWLGGPQKIITDGDRHSRKIHKRMAAAPSRMGVVGPIANQGI